MIQLLIVHRDADMAHQLVQMVKEYTGHDSASASSESETLVWLRRNPNVHPRILVTQLDAHGVDGFALGAMLAEMLPGLQTLFLPPYRASEQHLEIASSKVFPEPIDGERLIATIERSVRMLPDAPDLFDVVDVLQLCCLSKRSGAVQMVAGSLPGTIYLRDGQIVQAETECASAKEALVEVVSWGEIEFAYERGMRPAVEPLKSPWNQLLIEAMEERRRRALPQWRQSA